MYPNGNSHIMQPCPDDGADKDINVPCKTNADRIRSMTDEELRDAWFYILKNVVNRYNSSYLGLLVWLKEEVKRE